MKKWTVSRADAEAVRKIASTTDLTPFLAGIMAARGYDTVEKLAGFFNASELSDPFLLPDMDAAVEAINDAADSGDLICIYGDYDCDGITSTAVLYSYLSNMMGANATAMIPERGEGYGLNESAVRKMSEMGVSLIVTVDNGITAVAEAELIESLGMKLVITDHHQPTEKLPKAAAIVDPHLRGSKAPFRDLCGAGVVLKLCAALDGGSFDSVCEQYLDLVALATVADVVPLVGENRIIVTQGLRLLKNTENPGLLALFNESGTDLSKVTSTSLAFTLAPRINASSRFGSPKLALEMLLSEDGSAEELARELDRLNTRRRSAESDVIDGISAILKDDPSPLWGRVAVLSGTGWHRGVIGIVAARLVEALGKPVVVISSDGSGTSLGSARSVAGFNIFSCFDACRDLLVKYGGHELAGGLTVSDENIPALKKRIEEYAEKNFPEMPRLTLCADRLLSGGDLTPENAASLSRIEPFGQSNPEPLFALSGARISAVYPLKNGEHTKLELMFDGVRTAALMFRTRTADLPYSAGDSVDIMAAVGLNEYKGTKSVSLRVTDIRPHGIKQDRFFAAISAYESFRRGEIDAGTATKGNPTREELVDVYKYISAQKHPLTFERLCAEMSGKYNVFKLHIIADAFADTGLVLFDPLSGRIEAVKATSRVDIESSGTLKSLRSLIQGGGNNARTDNRNL